jgi:DNA-directed RNA polymerase subunit F
MEILDEKDIPLAKAKQILEKVRKTYKKEGKELLYEQKRAIDHVRKYAKLNLKQTQEMIKKLSELDLKLTPEQIVKICDLLPETVDDIRPIFAKERFKYNEEEIKKILDIVDQYR